MNCMDEGRWPRPHCYLHTRGRGWVFGTRFSLLINMRQPEVKYLTKLSLFGKNFCINNYKSKRLR